jgi:hypothetical protein
MPNRFIMSTAELRTTVLKGVLPEPITAMVSEIPTGILLWVETAINRPLNPGIPISATPNHSRED